MKGMFLPLLLSVPISIATQSAASTGAAAGEADVDSFRRTFTARTDTGADSLASGLLSLSAPISWNQAAPLAGSELRGPPPTIRALIRDLRLQPIRDIDEGVARVTFHCIALPRQPDMGSAEQHWLELEADALRRELARQPGSAQGDVSTSSDLTETTLVGSGVIRTIPGPSRDMLARIEGLWVEEGAKQSDAELWFIAGLGLVMAIALFASWRRSLKTDEALEPM